jgi:hypothetical protein
MSMGRRIKEENKIILCYKIKEKLKSFGINVSFYSSVIEAFCDKLSFLEGKGKYARLLRALLAANDKNEFFSYCFEVHFAYDFEFAGHALTYEETIHTGNNKKVDFILESNGRKLCFELRHVFESEWIKASKETQSKENGSWKIEISDEEGSKKSENGELLRFQSLIKEKLKKFPLPNDNMYHFIVINASEPLLGILDKIDCIEVSLGSNSKHVPVPHKHRIKGLFEEVGFIKKIHGIMFVKDKKSGLYIDSDFGYYIVFNPYLINNDEGNQILKRLSFLKRWIDKPSE